MVVLNAAATECDDRLDERFLDLICTVEALVDVEFEDIVCMDRSRTSPIEADPAREPGRAVAASPGRILSTSPVVAADAGTRALERSPPVRAVSGTC
jgi:hypothetical protein